MKQLDKKTRNLFSKVNPFGFTEEGEYLIWSSPQHCYEFGISLIAKFSKGGYIDLPLFMCSYQDIFLQDARRICKHKDIWEIHWSDLTRAKDEVEIVLGVMLQETGVPFDSFYFDKAWEWFVIN